MSNSATPLRFHPRHRRIHGLFATPLFACLILLGAALGCDRNIEPYQPGEESSAPDLARIFPAPIEGTGAPAGGEGASGGGAGRPAAGMRTGAVPRGAVPPSRAEGTAAQSAGSAGPIRGEIELDPSLAGARPAGGVLFVIARPQGVNAGPPLAVLRIPNPDFPLAFSIGPEDVMIPSMQFAGPISLSARLDEDGNAMTRGAGDISSPVIEALAPGAEGIRLTLSERS